MGRREADHFHFRGVKISNVRLEDARETIRANRNGKGYVCLTEVRNTMFAGSDAELREAINGSLLSLPDGTPLSWYGRLIGFRNVRRVAGFDLLASMLEERSGLKHFLLGDTEETIRRVIAKARIANPEARIAGYSPPFREEFGERDTEAIFDRIRREDPDVVWVCLGGGKQEKWMHRNFRKLDRGVMAGVGAAFRFYIGDIYLPPKWVQRIGMQWFFRMMGSSRAAGMMLQTHPKFCLCLPFEILKARKALRAGCR